MIYKRDDSKVKKIINLYELQFVCSSERTTIYQNEQFRMSVDEKVIRINILESNNKDLKDELNLIFYN